jgi:sugar/nucleoside kinase (ribokinase family)
MSLIVTGTIGIDTIETPVAKAVEVPGGSCAYFAAAASHFTPTRMVAAVGGDWPSEHRAVLESFPGIDLAGLDTRPDSKTFAWGGRYLDDMNQRETLFTHLGVVEEAPPAVPESFADSEYVFLANTHPAVQAGLLSQFPDRKLAVADTMDLWIDIANDDLRNLVQQVDGIVLNDAEAMQFTGARNAISAARAMLDMGLTFVVVKKGEHGCVLVHTDGIGALPAYPMPADAVIDPTGAGDTFAGGMMGHLASVDRCDLEALRASLAWGTVTASFTLEAFGLEGQRAIDRDAINARLDDFKQIVGLS